MTRVEPQRQKKKYLFCMAESHWVYEFLKSFRSTRTAFEPDKSRNHPLPHTHTHIDTNSLTKQHIKNVIYSELWLVSSDKPYSRLYSLRHRTWRKPNIKIRFDIQTISHFPENYFQLALWGSTPVL